jgi:FkbM family methyltransferase
MSEVHDHDQSIKIIAFEPVSEKLEILRNKFPWAELYDCALGESDTEVAFYVNTRQSAYSSLGTPNDDRDIQMITVPLRRLDGLVKKDEVDVIKIDVEGAELGVLRGAQGLITRCRPLVMFESAPIPDDWLGYSKESMWLWLADYNYEIVVPNRVAHDGCGLSLAGFVESHLYPRRTTNYFAIPKERRIEFRDRARKLMNVR